MTTTPISLYTTCFTFLKSVSVYFNSDQFKSYLAKKYFQQIKHLSELLGGPATAWLEQIDEIT